MVQGLPGLPDAQGGEGGGGEDEEDEGGGLNFEGRLKGVLGIGGWMR